MLGNGVIGILAESCDKWERRAPLTPSHCARLLHSGRERTGVARIVVQPSTKRIHHDSQYEDVGCEISDDLSECGLILGVKHPKLEMILPDRAYAFFSHTHKAQKESMPMLDKIISERVSLFDYELIVGDHGERLLAFGKYAGRAGLIDFLRGLGWRYLSLGYSTPFLSLGASYMYPSLAAAKAAVISVGEEIATLGLPSGICPLIFVFTGSGNVSLGAQEIFKLLPHTLVDPSRLPELFEGKDLSQRARTSKRVFQVYGCVVTSQDMVEHKDSTKVFDKADYYAHPEHYNPVFHEKIAPYASVIVNCMYWEKRFPRLLSTDQLQDVMRKGCPLVGVCDITCDVGGSIEFVNQTTSIDSPFFRYDPSNDSYYHDVEGSGVICSAVDILPTEFAKEASQHFGDILSQFVGSLASATDITKLPAHLKRACIAHEGALTSLYEYIQRMRKSASEEISEISASCLSNKKQYSILVSLSGHLFDQFLINEALDIIEAAGGSFHLVKCQVGQSANVVSYSELEVGANDRAMLDQIIDSLSAIANPNENSGFSNQETNKISLKVGKVQETGITKGQDIEGKTMVLILGAGRVCRPAAELLTSIGKFSYNQQYKAGLEDDSIEQNDVQVIVGSLYLKEAEEIVEGIPNATAIQLDVMDHENLIKYISQVEVVISLLPPSCHIIVANACIEVARGLWMHVLGILNVHWVMPERVVDVLSCWGRKFSDPFAKAIWRMIPRCIWWCLWRERNRRCFEDSARSLGSLQSDVFQFLFFWATAVLGLKKHLVTASYVDESMSLLDKKAKSAGITILGEMGLDPGIDHMMAMRMINHAHVRKGRIRSFTSYCGGLPSPAAANNPLAYKFSWNPAGAIRAGRNSATYRSHGETISIDGDSLFDSAVRLRLPDLPAFALECLPNRNSLVYGELYGIGLEASTIFRGTLRYEGFCEIMGTFARIGLLDSEAHPILKGVKRPTFGTFLLEVLKIESKGMDGPLIAEKDIAERIFTLGHCKEEGTAVKAAKTITFLGYHEHTKIPDSCRSAFDVTCLRMEERLAYSITEQDMVLLHHEVVVDFPDGQPTENHSATLLEFGRTENGKTISAMALTVGIPAGIGALLLLQNKIKTRGVLRPTEPEVYMPALDLLEAYGVKMMEKIE